MIRLFAALAVPDFVAEALTPLQCGLHGARWRPAESLHVTLRFFGDVSEPEADELDHALGSISGAPFAVGLQGLGAFGEGHRLNAVWAGVADSEPLRLLAGRCESAARRAGLKPETRNYHPHVTLAYLKGADEAEVAGWIAANTLAVGESFAVDRFSLFSSWSGRSGSSYRLEREYLLA